MLQKSSRDFTLPDATIFTAATAAGLSAARWWYEYTGEAFEYSPGFWLDLISWFLLPYSVALVLIRFRRPRLTLHNLARQPGWIAAIAAILAVPFQILDRPLSLIDAVLGWNVENFVWESGIADLAGALVLISWSVSGIAGGLVPEPSWQDRLGRILGATWIIIWTISRLGPCWNVNF